jgi:hypothetical protein
MNLEFTRVQELPCDQVTGWQIILNEQDTNVGIIHHVKLPFESLSDA